MLIFFTSTILASCASMFGSNTRTVKVESYPSGAGIFMDNQRVGTTPVVITLPTYLYGGKSIGIRKQG